MNDTETWVGMAAEPAFGIEMAKAKVHIHTADKCAGETCPFHNPSNHHMQDWPMLVRLDNWGLVERKCRHGVGHPDPDSVAFFERIAPDSGTSIHGCDGCC